MKGPLLRRRNMVDVYMDELRDLFMEDVVDRPNVAFDVPSYRSNEFRVSLVESAMGKVVAAAEA
jgi:hypothetical protein